MFFAILFLAVGIAIMLNTLGMLNGSFWGFFWAAVFIVWGIKLMMKRGKCPMCGWGNWENRIHEKIHQKMQHHCCDHDHSAE